jgi:hypothetical protein
LKVALRAYRAEHGKYPVSLTELEKGRYLHSLPDDPYGDGRTYRYRLSKPGEVLINPPRVALDRAADAHPIPQPSPADYLELPVGQAILWSIGPDHIDQNGQNLPVGLSLGQARPQDFVYLVPMGR